jgi:hypothetical protein
MPQRSCGFVGGVLVAVIYLERVGSGAPTVVLHVGTDGAIDAELETAGAVDAAEAETDHIVAAHAALQAVL